TRPERRRNDRERQPAAGEAAAAGDAAAPPAAAGTITTFQVQSGFACAETVYLPPLRLLSTFSGSTIRPALCPVPAASVMNGITPVEAQAVMVIVAEPAGSSNGSEVKRPTPTTVTVVPSTVTPGEAAAAGAWVATGAGVGVGVA